MLPERVFCWPVVLRHFRPSDAPGVQQLAGDPAVADTTAVIPHPYPGGLAEAWIATHEDERARGKQYVFAIARAVDEQLVGAIALRPVASEHENVGYWIANIGEMVTRPLQPARWSRLRSAAWIASKSLRRTSPATLLPVGYWKSAAWC